MKHTIFALALALVAGCAAPNAYSGTATHSEQTNAPAASDSNSGAGASEPQRMNTGNVFSDDDYQNQLRQYEAWEAGGG